MVSVAAIAAATTADAAAITAAAVTASTATATMAAALLSRRKEAAAAVAATACTHIIAFTANIAVNVRVVVVVHGCVGSFPCLHLHPLHAQQLHLINALGRPPKRFRAAAVAGPAAV